MWYHSQKKIILLKSGGYTEETVCLTQQKNSVAIQPTNNFLCNDNQSLAKLTKSDQYKYFVAVTFIFLSAKINLLKFSNKICESVCFMNRKYPRVLYGPTWILICPQFIRDLK